MRKYPIELLAPAKNLEAAIAAIDYGADAIYMGAERFGARRAAGNTTDDIARAVEYAHQYGARVHVALNTLLFDNELKEAENTARRLIDVGIDALIVQDMALRAMNLPVEMHASTQVSNTTAEGAKFLEECGFSRVILERALTLDDIKKIRQATNVELECFIHGAICVGYSGRCFLSRTTSQRSGNRGECSQPCRLPYDLKDASGRRILTGKHLLSVRDLDLSKSLEELIMAGVSSFKIEGRLKDVRYIKNIVAYYRQLLDNIISRHSDLRRASIGESSIDFTPNPAKSFTRGASSYMLYGKCGDVASFDTPKAVGEYIGRIESVTRNGFRLDTTATLSSGDGICIANHNGVGGTNINAVADGVIKPNRMDDIVVGAKLYRNYDHRFALALDRSKTRRTITCSAKLELSANGATLTIKDCEGIEVVISRECELQMATDTTKMAETARRQIEKSGGTIFLIRDVEITGNEYFAPASILNDLRREALDLLRHKRLQNPMSHDIKSDNFTAQYPSKVVTRYENVTNHLAEEFYRRHGVEVIEPALEQQPTIGERVMISSYCIRREIGECLKQKPKIKGDLFLEHGTTRYALKFDCKLCQMELWHLN
ncbi:MAG: U32 family peptidase [Alistipes sp.]|nr:U32 family peptidase [Alistipes sp.]